MELASVIFVSQLVAVADTATTQGEYLTRLASCTSCHTQEDGKFMAGGKRIKSPFGDFYAPNITPDPGTGIGNWDEQDFLKAMKEGVSPEGEHYYPSFPYTSYSKMTLPDLRAMWSYLKGIEPVEQPNKDHRLGFLASGRWKLGVWKSLNFEPGTLARNQEQSYQWNRGRYLVEAVSHCGECHTSRGTTGGLEQDKRMAGAQLPSGSVAPNITAHNNGIGHWSHQQLAHYLRTGQEPNGAQAGEEMEEVVQNSTRHLTPADALAIAEYILSLPPLNTAVEESE